MSERPLAGQVALVTGAAQGIGRSIALQLAAAGACVLANDLDEGPLRETCALIEASAGRSLAMVGSVTAEGFADAFVARALEAFGRIDILVNNAGYIWNSRIERTSDEQWNAMLDVHLGAPFRVCRALAQHWRGAERPAHSRRIVNVSSVSGTHGALGQIAYSSAKAGLVGLTKSLARELGPIGVNVNAVAFGLIETRLTQPIHGETSVRVGERSYRVGLLPEALEDFKARTPLQRGGTPEEAAGAVVLLCLPQSGYVTGQVLEVDGGHAI